MLEYEHIDTPIHLFSYISHTQFLVQDIRKYTCMRIFTKKDFTNIFSKRLYPTGTEREHRKSEGERFREIASARAREKI